jgi:predicted Na+-dependent transporter
MVRIYFFTMLLLLTGGIVCAVSATSHSGIGVGMVLLTVGAGGVSAGVMTRGAEGQSGDSTKKAGQSK